VVCFRECGIEAEQKIKIEIVENKIFCNRVVTLISSFLSDPRSFVDSLLVLRLYEARVLTATDRRVVSGVSVVVV
jgi:hypothetical protein